MVTTAASTVMAPIHDRMPALLRAEEMPDFLGNLSEWHFQPYNEPLVVKPCDSPLAKRKPTSDSQLDLF